MTKEITTDYEELTPVTKIEEDEEVKYNNTLHQIKTPEEAQAELEADLQKTRQYLLDQIEEEHELVRTAAIVADSAQDPRHYEAYAKVSSAFNGKVKQLLEIHTTRKQLTGKVLDDPQKPINNNLFVTTTDLLAIVKKAKEEAK